MSRFAAQIIVVVGIFCITVGVTFNQWVLAFLLTSDRRIDSPSERLLIAVFNITLILVGIALIAGSRRRSVQRVIFFTLYCLVIFIAFDYALYFASPILPETMVGWMSPHAQKRYLEANPEVTTYIYEGPIRYGRTGATVEYDTIADELGYRNPLGYLDEADKIDVLLIGDSFTWGTTEETMADILRDMQPETNFYSIGMPGNGITQWRYHYERFMTEAPVNAAPDIVILNFFSGNDVNDTHLAVGLLEKEGELRSSDYNAFINYQYLAPSSRRPFQLPKPPEMFFIASYFLAAGSASSQDVAPNGANEHPLTDTNLFEESDPALLDAAVLLEIERAVQTIRDYNADTTIILSYIAPASVLYADILKSCGYCADDVNRQLQNSETLARLASELGILFHDPTSAMAEGAQTQLLWAENAHYSQAGYSLFSAQLANFLETQP